VRHESRPSPGAPWVVAAMSVADEGPSLRGGPGPLAIDTIPLPEAKKRSWWQYLLPFLS
jgi:hypothetical protein